MTRNSCRVGRACAARAVAAGVPISCAVCPPHSAYSETLDFHFDAICGMDHGAGYSVRRTRVSLARWIAYRAVSSPYLRRTLQRKDGPWPAPGYKQEQVTVTHAPRTTTANTKSLQCLHFARFV